MDTIVALTTKLLLFISSLSNGHQRGAEIGNGVTSSVAENLHSFFNLSQVPRQGIDSEPKTNDRLNPLPTGGGRFGSVQVHFLKYLKNALGYRFETFRQFK